MILELIFGSIPFSLFLIFSYPLFMPFLAILSILLLLPFAALYGLIGLPSGSIDIRSNIFYEMAAEATPPGTWPVTLVRYPLGSELVHSLIYNDESIVSQIVALTVNSRAELDDESKLS